MIWIRVIKKAILKYYHGSDLTLTSQKTKIFSNYLHHLTLHIDSCILKFVLYTTIIWTVVLNVFVLIVLYLFIYKLFQQFSESSVLKLNSFLKAACKPTPFFQYKLIWNILICWIPDDCCKNLSFYSKFWCMNLF